ncbi:phage tail assembly protein (plasmid) [Escherichia coli]|nr:phage tail assembly protein [Escherichia coli]
MSQTPSDTFKLSYPFTTAAGTRIELVELKRLTVKDLKQVRKISKNPADWDEPLIARSTGLLPEDLDNMDLADYLQLQKRFQLITGMGESNQGADAGAGAAGEMVPVSAGGDDALDTDDLEMWLEQLKSK